MGKKACGDGATLCRYWRESTFLLYVSRLTWALYWFRDATYNGISLFGGPQILPLWSILESSPIYKYWDWSPLIHSDLEANGIPPPSNSASALVRKSLPPTHPWVWKTPLKRSTGSSEGLSANPLQGRSAYHCTRPRRHGLHVFSLQVPIPHRMFCTNSSPSMCGEVTMKDTANGWQASTLSGLPGMPLVYIRARTRRFQRSSMSTHTGSIRRTPSSLIRCSMRRTRLHTLTTWRARLTQRL